MTNKKVTELKKDGTTYDLSNLPGKSTEPELPVMPITKTWQPNGETHTMKYGASANNPNPGMRIV